MRQVLHVLLLLVMAASVTAASAAELRVGLAVEPDSIDPHVHNFGGNKAFMPNLFDTLTVIDANGRLAPGLATSWKTIDATTWEIKLREGVDVVVGVVETHGRRETEALVQGLEVIPRRRIAYKGRIMEEMDLDAVLARRPRLVLVDELAHTNAPESRHPKRYMDVEELLAAGIDVYTTLNVQHLEGLGDAVERLTVELAAQIDRLRMSARAAFDAMRTPVEQAAPPDDAAPEGPLIAALISKLRQNRMSALDDFAAAAPQLKRLLGPGSFAIMSSQLEHLEFATAADTLETLVRA